MVHKLCAEEPRGHHQVSDSIGSLLSLWLLLCGGLMPGGLCAGEPQAFWDMPLEQRVTTRSFPSVFQAWNPADNLKSEDKLTTLARHDLVFSAPGFFGLKWNQLQEGLATGFTPESIRAAKAIRGTFLAKNSHLVLIAEIRYRDAHRSYLPTGHPWWKRDLNGKLEMGWDEGGFIKLDIANPEFQKHIATQAGAVVASGVVDGVMLDWWDDDDARLQLIKRVREAVGKRALILANANDRTMPRSAAYINGYFMECWRSKTPEDWKRISDTLAWAEANLREPRINCLETWFHHSRADLNLMRATTTLALTVGDGYCLFSDPNDLPTGDHLHSWYAFWEKRLGRPLAKGVKRADGSILREFEGGAAVYNPMGNAPAKIVFSEPRTSLVTGKRALSHGVPAGDGDLFGK